MVKDETKKLRIAAIGDPHIKETSAGTYREMFAEISEKADVLILCGDLTDHGNLKEVQVLAEELESCKIPVVGVLGNHDYAENQQDKIRAMLSPHVMTLLEGEPVEIKGVGFAGVKGFCGGFDNHMLSAFGEEAIRRFVQESLNEALSLENALSQLKSSKKVVALHYSPISETLRGEPLELFPYLGSSRLAEPINRFDATAVFHGHAHYGIPEGKTLKGIPVYNCSIDVMKRKHVKQPYALVEI